jgi:hypothetical protein
MHASWRSRARDQGAGWVHSSVARLRFPLPSASRSHTAVDSYGHGRSTFPLLLLLQRAVCPLVQYLISDISPSRHHTGTLAGNGCRNGKAHSRGFPHAVFRIFHLSFPHSSASRQAHRHSLTRNLGGCLVIETVVISGAKAGTKRLQNVTRLRYDSISVVGCLQATGRGQYNMDNAKDRTKAGQRTE